jgi:hypothetical protein
VNQDLPDPLVAIFDILQRLPEDVRQPVVQWLRETLNPSDEVTGRVSVMAEAQTAEAYGTVYPPTIVRVEPGQLTLEPVEATPVAGSPPGPLAWQKDLFVAAVVVFVILSFYDRSFTEGLAEALRELCLILIGLSAPAVLLEWWRQR